LFMRVMNTLSSLTAGGATRPILPVVMTVAHHRTDSRRPGGQAMLLVHGTSIGRSSDAPRLPLDRRRPTADSLAGPVMHSEHGPGRCVPRTDMDARSSTAMPQMPTPWTRRPRHRRPAGPASHEPASGPATSRTPSASASGRAPRAGRRGPARAPRA
jgi:hypothetical protein